MPYDRESPFMLELTSGRTLNVNGSPMPTAIWNLIVSKRDLTLWCRIGMKPTRRWKVTDAKRYFGIKGSRLNLLNNFMELYTDVMGEDDNE